MVDKLILRLDFLYFMSVKKYLVCFTRSPKNQESYENCLLEMLPILETFQNGRAASKSSPNIRNLTATTSFQVGTSFQNFSLPETNIAPEHGWLEDEFSLRKAYFQG